MLPVNFSYLGFAALIFFNSVGMGMFIAPNQTGIMNSLPANQRGAGAGMAGTFNSSAQVLSIGIFFTLMILGLAATLPVRALHGLVAQGVSPAVATRVSHLPAGRAASSPPSSATTRCRTLLGPCRAAPPAARPRRPT